MHAPTTIPGYTYGTNAVSRSPLTPAEFELMKQSVLFTDENVKYLRLSHEVVKDLVEAILDVWYVFVGSNAHLLASFTGKSDGQPLNDYLGGVRKRFGQWILDTARASSINRGSIISTRSASAIIAPRKIKLTGQPQRTLSRFVICSCSSSR